MIRDQQSKIASDGCGTPGGNYNGPAQPQHWGWFHCPVEWAIVNRNVSWRLTIIISRHLLPNSYAQIHEMSICLATNFRYPCNQYLIVVCGYIQLVCLFPNPRWWEDPSVALYSQIHSNKSQVAFHKEKGKMKRIPQPMKWYWQYSTLQQFLGSIQHLNPSSHEMVLASSLQEMILEVFNI